MPPLVYPNLAQRTGKTKSLIWRGFRQNYNSVRSPSLSNLHNIYLDRGNSASLGLALADANSYQ